MTTTQPLFQQHAIVTGASRGVGAAIADTLAQLGACITLMGRHDGSLQKIRAGLIEKYGAECFSISADVTDHGAIERAIEAARARFGTPAILVNNAGMASSVAFDKMSDTHWQEMIGVNLTGVFNLCRTVVPLMRAAGYGRIINIASTAGQTGYAYVAAYCAAKHGVIGLTRALALEYAAKGITVNAVCPGYMDTDMTKETLRNIVEKTGRTQVEALATLLQTNPQGRLIAPEEVAEMVGFLALPSSRSMTGQAISLSGGEIMT